MPCHICRSLVHDTSISSGLCSNPGEPTTHRHLCPNCAADLLDLLDGCATAYAAGYPDVLSEAADLVASTNADDGNPEDDEDNENDEGTLDDFDNDVPPSDGNPLA